VDVEGIRIPTTAPDFNLKFKVNYRFKLVTFLTVPFFPQRNMQVGGYRKSRATGAVGHIRPVDTVTEIPLRAGTGTAYRTSSKSHRDEKRFLGNSR